MCSFSSATVVSEPWLVQINVSDGVQSFIQESR
jgi:hypothetical protein